MKKMLTLHGLLLIFSFCLFSQNPQNNSHSTNKMNEFGIDITDKWINLYPNPVVYDFTLEFYTSDRYNISIMSNKGKIVSEQNNIADKIIINCQDMPSGTYYLRILNLSDNSFFSRRIIKL